MEWEGDRVGVNEMGLGRVRIGGANMPNHKALPRSASLKIYTSNIVGICPNGRSAAISLEQMDKYPLTPRRTPEIKKSPLRCTADHTSASVSLHSDLSWIGLPLHILLGYSTKLAQ